MQPWSQWLTGTAGKDPGWEPLPGGFDERLLRPLGTLRDQLLFPEIDYMKVDKARGMNVSVVTTAKTDEEARKLLQFIGMPFRQ